MYIGIDIGGTETKYIVFDQAMNVQERGKYKSQDDLNHLIQSVKEVYDKYTGIKGIGISVPGFVNISKKLIVKGGAFRSLDNCYLVDELNKYINCPIYMENDANCAALAERLYGNAQGIDNFLCQTIGTGVGAGIFINGKLYHGHSYKAGEFGYMVVKGLDGYENTDMASISNIAATRPLVNMVSEKLGKVVDGQYVLENSDNDAINEVYYAWLESVALGIYNQIYSFDPEVFLVGGGISRNTKFMSGLRAKINEIDPNVLSTTNLQPCKLLNDAGCYGSVYYFF